MFSASNFLEENCALSKHDSRSKEINPERKFQDLSSLLLNLGNDPSQNLISILEFGPGFLGCKHLNYRKIEDLSTSSSEQEASSLRFPIRSSDKELVLFEVHENPNPENLRIFTALLTQQEKSLRNIMKMRSLKEYSKALFESCPDGLVVTDRKGFIINTNRAMVSMTRKPLNTLIGMRVGQLAPKESRVTAFQALRKLKTQSKSRFECRLKIGAGRTLPVSISFNHCLFQGETLVLATVRDLSFLEDESKKLSQYEQSLANAIQNATDGFLQYDQFGRIVEANPEIERMTGVFQGRLVGRPVDDLLDNTCLRGFRRAVSQLCKQGYATFDSVLRTASNTTIPCRATLMQFEMQGERYCRMMLQDTRQQKRRDR